jgi:hypothetical protein
MNCAWTDSLVKLYPDPEEYEVREPTEFLKEFTQAGREVLGSKDTEIDTLLNQLKKANNKIKKQQETIDQLKKFCPHEDTSIVHEVILCNICGEVL